MICAEEGNKTQYIGETSRSTFERMEEHRKIIMKKKTESPLIEHHIEKHENQEPSFRAKVVLSVQKPLERQCREGYLIGNPPEGVTLMNRKGEWGQNLPPKFTYDQPQDEQGKRKFNLAKNRPKKRKNNGVTESTEMSEIQEIPRSAPLWNSANNPESPEIPVSVPLWNCGEVCETSHTLNDSCDTRDSRKKQVDSQQQGQGHNQNDQNWSSKGRAYTTTESIERIETNANLSLAWADDFTTDGKLEPGDINFLKNKPCLASIKGDGCQIAGREIGAKRIKLRSPSNEIIQCEVKINRSKDQNIINTPEIIDQPISTTASKHSVDKAVEEEDCYPAPPDRSVEQQIFETSPVTGIKSTRI